MGREREVAEVAGLLRAGELRLVTLTGPGGAGKTRLALQVAAELADEFADGAYFVPLAAIGDSELVVPAIEQALDVSEAAGQSLAAYLATKRVLLLLDNLEQVLGAAPVIAAILRGAAGVRIIATSREPLHVTAEQVYPVAPLGLPDISRRTDAVTALGHDAVALFAHRARAAAAGFAVTDANAAAVAELCVRLDGLPLALELAAARISLLSPEAMLARLSDRLTLLTGGARDQPARLQTLRNTLTWSHDLLTDDERVLFRRLAVLPGGFTLAAAEEIADAQLDLLGSLMDKSLVVRRADRFAMLETIREFAREQLDASGEGAILRERQAASIEGLAERAFAARLANQERAANDLEQEADNIRAALDHLAAVDGRRYARLVSLLGWFWHAHSHFAEGRARVGDAMGRLSTEAAEDRARLLAAGTELAAWHGDAVAAERLGAEAIAAWRSLGRDTEVALVLHDLGWATFFSGGDLERGRHLMEESLAIHGSQGDPLLVNRAQLGLLQILVALGDVATVKRLGPEAVAVSQRLGDRWSEHFAHHFLGDCAVIEGDVAEARLRYRLSLEAAWESGDQAETCYELQGMGMAAAGAADAVRALRLIGAADATLRDLGVGDLPPFWSDLIERHVALARNQLDGSVAEAAWQAGQSLPLAQAVGEGLSDTA